MQAHQVRGVCQPGGHYGQQRGGHGLAGGDGGLPGAQVAPRRLHRKALRLIGAAPLLQRIRTTTISAITCTKAACAIMLHNYLCSAPVNISSCAVPDAVRMLHEQMPDRSPGGGSACAVLQSPRWCTCPRRCQRWGSTARATCDAKRMSCMLTTSSLDIARCAGCENPLPGVCAGGAADGQAREPLLEVNIVGWGKCDRELGPLEVGSDLAFCPTGCTAACLPLRARLPQ